MKDCIDCHVHFLNKKDYEIYKKTACADKVINIRGINIEEMLKPYRFEDFADCSDMYFLDSVDLNHVDESLKNIEKDLIDYKNIIGIKIYLGYQKFYANDRRIKEVAEFASKNKLAITFHCGEILGENDESIFSEFSDAKYIEELLNLYPNTTFIASHLNWPNFSSIFEMCSNYSNIYTCLSGTNDGETKADRINQNQYIAKTINKYIEKYPQVKKKIMYGTDFFASSDEYNDVSSYEELINLLNITEQERQDIMYNNVKRAYGI